MFSGNLLKKRLDYGRILLDYLVDSVELIVIVYIVGYIGISFRKVRCIRKVRGISSSRDFLIMVYGSFSGSKEVICIFVCGSRRSVGNGLGSWFGGSGRLSGGGGCRRG